MWGHASLLHLLMNLLAWLMLWRILTVWRTLAAWACAVGVWLLMPKSPPVVGWSVIICFYLGMLFASKHRWDILVPILAGFLLPGVAAWHHLLMLTCGMIYRKTEVRWRRTRY
jgi:hypothetical protein